MVALQQREQQATPLSPATFGLVQAPGTSGTEGQFSDFEHLEDGRFSLISALRGGLVWRIRDSSRGTRAEVQQAENAALVSLWTDADGEYDDMKAKALTLQAVQVVLEAGADTEAKDKDGGTALMMAASEGHVKVARLLLEAGADVEAKDESGATALVKAASLGGLEAVRLLLTVGADIDAKDNAGWTALMSAAAFNRLDVACLLLESGADLEIYDEQGKTALMQATAWRNAEVAHLLLNAGDEQQADAARGRDSLERIRMAAI